MVSRKDKWLQFWIYTQPTSVPRRQHTHPCNKRYASKGPRQNKHRDDPSTSRVSVAEAVSICRRALETAFQPKHGRSVVNLTIQLGRRPCRATYLDNAGTCKRSSVDEDLIHDAKKTTKRGPRVSCDFRKHAGRPPSATTDMTYPSTRARTGVSGHRLR